MGITYLVICIFKFCINESMANNLCFNGIQCLSPPTLCHVDGVRKNNPGEEQECLKGLQEVSEMGNVLRRLEGWRCLTEEGLDSQQEGGVSVLSFALVTLLPASLRNWELSEENFLELWAMPSQAPAWCSWVLRAPLGCSVLPLGAQCSPCVLSAPPRCSALPRPAGTSPPPGSPFPPGPPLNSALLISPPTLTHSC